MTNLDKAAIIFRKYSQGGFDEFRKTFAKQDERKLKTAFDLSLNKIQNREIIKDSTDLSFEELKKVEEKLKSIETKDFFFSLNDSLDLTKLKLKDEKIERRLRHVLAKRYIDILTKEKEEKSETRKGYFKATIFLLLLVALFNFNKIKQGLTPVDSLANQLHEKSKYKFSGAVCNDGWISHSQGSGTCSHHDGVMQYFDKGDHSKTYEECLQEAKSKSWLDE